MLAKKTIATLIIISSFFAFFVPFAVAGGAGATGDVIAWYFEQLGFFVDSGRGSKATGRVTSYQPIIEDRVGRRPGAFTCDENSGYPTYPNITVELNRGKLIDLYIFRDLVSNVDGDPFCSADYGAQLATLVGLLKDALGGTIYWNSVKTVAWTESETPSWQIFEFSITIP